ncbi:UNVERIFIED_CONTAM: hypothetical protein Sradi_6910600 [Sesamum radiatum]|uniref:Uncharacterized protein n=1 Tax=Sesamum radiatum TaxID=300843 RepID=A0AAW2JHE8_SESRA
MASFFRQQLTRLFSLAPGLGFFRVGSSLEPEPVVGVFISSLPSIEAGVLSAIPSALSMSCWMK